MVEKVNVARCGIIGYPLDHTRSPELHRSFAEQCGVDQTYVVFAVTDGDFEQTVRTFFADGGRGLNVTLPYKERALTVANNASKQAVRAGAANVLTQQTDGTVRADNADGVGFLADLERQNFDMHGARVCVLGAGGAAAGVIAALLDAEADTVAVLNRSPQRARALVERMEDKRLQLLPAQPDAFDLVINATSASLANECPAFPNAVIGPNTLAYDLAYAAKPTPFMQRAAQLGARTCDGWGMLVEQAAESFQLWHGIRPDTVPLLRRFPPPG
ncbi:MAG: shikimate dehydrogenase [Gammaproteobacteria bacterium]